EGVGEPAAARERGVCRTPVCGGLCLDGRALHSVHNGPPGEGCSSRLVHRRAPHMTVTLITGANKGIGLETARRLVALGHDVYLGARDAGRGRAAADEVGARFVPLDVTDDASVTAALATIDADHGRLDVLVHNAGVLGDGDVDGAKALTVFDTNAVGVVRVTEAALPLLRRSSHANVVTVSSSAGSFWAVTNPERVEHS